MKRARPAESPAVTNKARDDLMQAMAVRVVRVHYFSDSPQEYKDAIYRQYGRACNLFRCDAAPLKFLHLLYRKEADNR